MENLLEKVREKIREIEDELYSYNDKVIYEDEEIELTENSYKYEEAFSEDFLYEFDDVCSFKENYADYTNIIEEIDNNTTFVVYEKDLEFGEIILKKQYTSNIIEAYCDYLYDYKISIPEDKIEEIREILLSV